MDLHTLIQTFYGGSPYDGFDASSYELDLGGWNSEETLLLMSIKNFRPTTIIEVGSWKGRSAVQMAKEAESIGLDTTILCVDTWLGGPEHWVTEAMRQELRIEKGDPRLYDQFRANIIKSGLEERILPLRLSSLAAAKALSYLGSSAEMVYIDGGHEETVVHADISAFWEILEPGGVMVGDDYHEDWPGVIAAVNRFAHEHTLKITAFERKWGFQKAPAPAASGCQ